MYVCLFVCVCVYFASDSSETVEVIIVKLGMVDASDMIMHHVLSILTLTFIQGHTDLNRENNKCFDCFRSHLSNAHQICCEDSPTKGLCNLCQYDDLDLHVRLHMRLKLFYILTCNISDYI